jgi:DnaJ like chaperone protein
MRWAGKLVGGALGMLVGGPAGAALGALAGHVVDEKADSDEAARSDSGAGRGAARSSAGSEAESAGDGDDWQAGPGEHAAVIAERFFRTTFEVMGHVAKADGRVSNEEIRAARNVMSEFGLSDGQVAAAIEHFTRGKQPDYDLSASVMALRRASRGRPDLLLTFLEIQMRAALAGTDLRGPVRPLLTRIAAMLGVGGMEFAHLEAVLRLRNGWTGDARRGPRGAGSGSGHAVGPQRMRIDEAYQILEVDAASSNDEVTKAYRRQLSRHHPDKLKANGLPESMLEHAKQRTQQIIEAWDLIRAKRGLS